MLSVTLAVLVVLVGSALCSGTETALLSANAVRARHRADEGSRAAQALVQIKEHLARPIAAIVVLNNVFNIVGSIAVGTLAAAEFGERWVGVVSGVLTFLVILFAEILPKTLGERYADRVALWVALPVRWVTVAMTPVVLLFEVLTRPLVAGGRAPSISEAEIRLLARIGRSEGVIEDAEMEMIHRVFELNDRTARDLMTPRVAVTWLDGATPVGDVSDEVLRSPHSRIVVAPGDLDQADQVVHKQDLLRALLEQPSAPVAELARPLLVVPWVTKADQLLRQFQREREHLALVVDEFGGSVGVVTLEDVLEVLTGPIVDETDQRADLRAYARARAATRLRHRRG
jgi:CBS domain containing-hemolysin-like protein